MVSLPLFHFLSLYYSKFSVEDKIILIHCSLVLILLVKVVPGVNKMQSNLLKTEVMKGRKKTHIFHEISDTIGYF